MTIVLLLVSITAQAQYKITDTKSQKGTTYAVLEVNDNTYRVFSTGRVLLNKDEIVATYGAVNGTIDLIRNKRRISIRVKFHGRTYFSESEAKFKMRRISDGTGLW